MMTKASQTLYRDNLSSILEFSGDRHMLSLSEVKRYTGIAKDSAVHRRFPFFVGGYISAESLARCLCQREARR